MSVQTRERVLGARIRELRLKRGLRQTDLAEKAGLSWRHLLRIEKGEGGVAKPATLARIAEALAVKPSELTGEDEDDSEADPAMRDAFALFVDLMDVLQGRQGQSLGELVSGVSAAGTSSPTGPVQDGAA